MLCTYIQMYIYIITCVCLCVRVYKYDNAHIPSFIRHIRMHDRTCLYLYCMSDMTCPRGWSEHACSSSLSTAPSLSRSFSRALFLARSLSLTFSHPLSLSLSLSCHFFRSLLLARTRARLFSLHRESSRTSSAFLTLTAVAYLWQLPRSARYVYVAVCCSVLQCVAVCCSALQCVAVCCLRLATAQIDKVGVRVGGS